MAGRGQAKQRVVGTDRGFTLLEGVLVVAVLGVLVALALPAYRNVMLERKVQNTAREIAGLLRAAQQLAVAKSAEAYCVTVVFGERQLDVYAVVDEQDEQGQQVFCGIGAPPRRGTPKLITSQEFPQGVRVEVSPAQLRSVIQFDPSGERLGVWPVGLPPDSQVALVTVRADGHCRMVRVNRAGLVWVPPAGESCP